MTTTGAIRGGVRREVLLRRGALRENDADKRTTVFALASPDAFGFTAPDEGNDEENELESR